MTEQVLDQRRVRAWRWRTHQLDAEPDSVTDVADVAILDLGVQETGPIGALWSLVCRGLVPPEEVERELAWAWTLRGAPHAYRRRDLAKVGAATVPYDEQDAANRVFDASTPLRRNDVRVLDELQVIGREQRDLVRDPITKGAVSAALVERLEPYSLRWCVPCQATHPWELPFRLAALQAGLEIEPGTSPPVMRRTLRARPQLFAPRRRERRFDPIRAFLHFLGPASAHEIAAYLDGAVGSIEERLDDSVVPLRVEGLPGVRHLLAGDIDTLLDLEDPSGGVVRLLGPFDPYLQLRDRELLVPDKADRQQLWKSLGRPGAVVLDGEVVGVWRPRSAGRRLTVRLGLWQRLPPAARRAVDTEAERLATHRGQSLREVVEDL